MSTENTVLIVVDVPDKRWIHLRTNDKRFCFKGLVDFCALRKNPQIIKSTWEIRREVSVVHRYMSEKLLSEPLVQRVSFFWGGMDVLMSEVNDETRNLVILEISKIVKRIFPEEEVRIEVDRKK